MRLAMRIERRGVAGLGCGVICEIVKEKPFQNIQR